MELSPSKTPNSPSKLFQCRQCEKIFKRSSNRRQHETSVHMKPFVCGICESSFGTKQKLEKHRLSRHSNQGSPRTVRRQLFPPEEELTPAPDVFIPLSDSILNRYTESELDSIIASFKNPIEFQDWLVKELVTNMSE